MSLATATYKEGPRCGSFPETAGPTADRPNANDRAWE